MTGVSVRDRRFFMRLTMKLPSLLLATALTIATVCGSDDSELTDQERWPLIFAAGEGDHSLVKKLLDLGYDVDGRSKDGETALHVAAIRGHIPTLQALLAAGAEVDARTPKGGTIYMTPSMWATYHGHTEYVRFLLAHGADPAAEDENGKSLLTMSIEAQKPDIEALIRAHLDKSQKDEV